MMVIPGFQTNRLILRGPTLEDADSYQKNFADYEVIRFLSASVPWPYPKNGAYEFLKSYILPRQGNDHWVWGIFLKNNPSEMIGGIELWREESPENRGFWLGKKFWGKGIMSEALEPITDHAFNDLGFERLILANAVGNTRSHNVKRQSGAKLVDVRPAKFVDPQFTEHEIWELTKEDWANSTQTFQV